MSDDIELDLEDAIPAPQDDASRDDIPDHADYDNDGVDPDEQGGELPHLDEAEPKEDK